MLNDFSFFFWIWKFQPLTVRVLFEEFAGMHSLFHGETWRRSNSSGRTIMQMQAKSRKNAEGNYVNGREWNKTATGLLGTVKFKIQSLVTLVSLCLSVSLSFSLFLSFCTPLFSCETFRYLCETTQEILKKFFFWICVLKMHPYFKILSLYEICLEKNYIISRISEENYFNTSNLISFVCV